MSSSADWRKLYPFSSHFLTLPEARLHYVDEGSGEPVLMVHGNPTWSFYWRNIITQFRDTHRMVAADHIGCGLSDKPQQYNYCLQQHIDNIVQLIDELDLQDINLLVHDWGGAVGLGAALARPERFARLVLFNTAAFPPPYCPLRIRACRIPMLGPWMVRSFNAFARPALTMATEKPERFTPDVCAGYLAPYDNYANRIATARFVQDIPLSQSHPTYAVLKQIEQQLPTLSHLPIQLIWGGKDWCFRLECLERFQTIWPAARATIFNDAGHYVVEDASERIEPILRDFLQPEPLSRKTEALP
ncbi:alpha/beta fold hydrolase [Bremerella alba]|uniref:Haloalkane dehalogenase 2 n=1 Tax=Bremerella alba TaxID=980252 RepID=A0A7V8V808_9BACT|nr:alpha/beta fold hydrolase [Bremerella alba]MBA2116644.1 Haloalkane dehalogenase 2 [Bremerella alba]